MRMFHWLAFAVSTHHPWDPLCYKIGKAASCKWNIFTFMRISSYFQGKKKSKTGAQTVLFAHPGQKVCSFHDPGSDLLYPCLCLSFSLCLFSSLLFLFSFTCLCSPLLVYSAFYFSGLSLAPLLPIIWYIISLESLPVVPFKESPFPPHRMSLELCE